MTYAFLPHADTTWLCLANGPQVTPLAPAPGMGDAIRRFSSDGSEFGFLDQSGKRLGHYRLLQQAPWIECLLAPTALPKSCVAADFVIHKGTLIAGGKGVKGEALWARRPAVDVAWRPIPLPEGVGKFGKSIDALFVRDNKLIAVDDHILPKWILVYPLEPELRCEGVEKIKLQSHTSDEQVVRATEGKDYYALYSVGWNHGRILNYMALLRKSDLKQVAVWSGLLPPSIEKLNRDLKWAEHMTDDLEVPDDIQRQQQTDAVLKQWNMEKDHAETTLGPMFKSMQDMAFCGKYLVLALGESGLGIADANAKASAEIKNSKGAKTSFIPWPLKVLRSVQRLQCPFENAIGFYAIGLDSAGAMSYEWVPMPSC